MQAQSPSTGRKIFLIATEESGDRLGAASVVAEAGGSYHDEASEDTDDRDDHDEFQKRKAACLCGHLLNLRRNHSRNPSPGVK